MPTRRSFLRLALSSVAALAIGGQQSAPAELKPATPTDAETLRRLYGIDRNDMDACIRDVVEKSAAEMRAEIDRQILNDWLTNAGLGHRCEK